MAEPGSSPTRSVASPGGRPCSGVNSATSSPTSARTRAATALPSITAAGIAAAEAIAGWGARARPRAQRVAQLRPSPRERGPDRHGRARGISFGGAVLPRGRPATQGQDGSLPIALARGPAAGRPSFGAWSRGAQGQRTRPEQPAQELQLRLAGAQVLDHAREVVAPDVLRGGRQHVVPDGGEAAHEL